MSKVIPKKLWIEQVIHALTVTRIWVIHALTVTYSRINGHHTNKEPVSTFIKDTYSRCYAFWGQPYRLPPNQLALATNSPFKTIKIKETKQKTKPKR